MRIRRIRRHMEYIARDDELLTTEDMGASLSPSELAEALQERGM
jgi:LETM1 and EF-hand domain-containing protein 1